MHKEKIIPDPYLSLHPFAKMRHMVEFSQHLLDTPLLVTCPQQTQCYVDIIIVPELYFLLHMSKAMGNINFHVNILKSMAHVF